MKFLSFHDLSIHLGQVIVCFADAKGHLPPIVIFRLTPFLDIFYQDIRRGFLALFLFMQVNSMSAGQGIPHNPEEYAI